MEIRFLVRNPEAHVFALRADGFRELKPRMRLSSWPTRCLRKEHEGGLVKETQHVDMSRSPVHLAADHKAPVVMGLEVNRAAMKTLLEEKRPGGGGAFLSLYGSLIATLKAHPEALQGASEEAGLFREFMALVDSLKKR